MTLLRAATKAAGGETFASARAAAMLYFHLGAVYVAAALALYTCYFLPVVLPAPKGVSEVRQLCRRAIA